MEELNLKIGDRLREIRISRQMSLENVAELTGVSKPMLGQIERGKSTPTINTLWKIATGLKVPLSSFCRQNETQYRLVFPDDENVITEENGQMRAFPLFPYDPIRNIEIFYIEFDAGVQHSSERHADGVEEYVSVVHGTLEMVIGQERVILNEKQSIRFRADVPHSYNNCSKDQCTVYNMIFYLNA